MSPISPRARLIIAAVALHAALIALLIAANLADDEQTSWTAADGARTSIWDLEGRFTMVAHATSAYLLAAAAFSLRRAFAQRGRLLALMAAVFLFAALDNWLSWHNLPRDLLFDRRRLPPPLLDPVMLLYLLGASAVCVHAWRNRAAWPRPTCAALGAGVAFHAVVYLLDGPLGLRLGFTTDVIGVEELLQCCAAFCYALAMYLSTLTPVVKC